MTFIPDFESIVWTSFYYVLFKFIIRLILFVKSFHKHFLMQEIDLGHRYGRESWVLITGPSSGQGRLFALNFAKRGFNLVSVGSHRTPKVIEEIHKQVPTCQIRFIKKDFRRAFDDGFFDKIIELVQAEQVDISVLVNCIGHRIGWVPHHEMPADLMRGCIAAGTIVQARLCHMMIPHFLKRRHKRSAIISVTAQCIHPNFGPWTWISNQISVPGLDIYEPTNAWGHYHMNAMIDEYGDRMDMLNVTPGAVLTENTRETLKHTIGAADAERFVGNVMRMLGQVQGETCGDWWQELTLYVMCLLPPFTHYTLKKTGRDLAEAFMIKYAKTPLEY